MKSEDTEEKLLRSAALQTSNSVLLLRKRYEEELLQAKEALERKTEQLARSLAMMRATLESTTDGILVTDNEWRVTGFNENFIEMWRLPREVIAARGANWLQEELRSHFADEEKFMSRIKAIYAVRPGETYDLLELLDGRVIERFSRVQRSEGRNVGRVWSFRDITQRRRAELELREQSEWFSVTLGSIGDAVVAVDTGQRIAFLNPVAEKLTGWSTAEAVGKSIVEVLHIVREGTRQVVENPILIAVREGRAVALANHTTLIRRDGAEIPIEDSAAPIKSSAGELLGAVMVFHDVSERRQREIALAKSEERFRLLGQVAPQLLWTSDAAGGFDYCNERWVAYTGQTIAAASGEGWLQAVHPDDRKRTRESWERCVKGGLPCEIEHRLRCADGDYCWFVTRSAPLRDDSGHIVRWYGSCTDFHQHKLTAEALREEHSITDHLHEVARALATELDLSKVVQIITDAGTRITRAQFGAFFYNVLDEHGAAYMLYTLSGVPREMFEEFPMPRATQLFGPTFRGEGVIRAADIRTDSRFGKNPPYHGMPPGHLPVVSYLAVSVTSRTGEVLGGLFFGHEQADVFNERDEKIVIGLAAQAAAAMDVARLYQAEQRARAAAERASHAKDHFLATLSHELRTPLTPVLAILSSLRNDAAIPPELAGDLETVRRNVELEARLIDDLLDLTRIARGKLELHYDRTPIRRMIDDAVNTCLPELQAKGLTLQRDIQGADRIVVADSARITQILWNLLKNSIKFTPAGGTITIRSRPVACDGQEQLLVEVEDSGIGIAAENLKRVFEAFEQADRGITRRFGGLGLGLAISKAIAEAHQGTLTASSAGVDCGSTFSLQLPVDVRAEGDGGSFPAESTETGSRPAHRALRILLVEDHADTAAILIRLLGRMGHEVLHASTVGGALELTEKEMAGAGIDLVMSDLGLPDGSGLELMRELSTKYGLRGIALSGFGMESDVAQSSAAGFAKHLIKPIDIATLRTALTEMTPRQPVS